MINELEIRKTIQVLNNNNNLFEIRIIHENKKMYSGYFDNADTLIASLKKQRLDNANVYITLNAINSACFDRTQKNKFELNCKATTSDNDIIGYKFLMVDLDPIRPTGTSSTDEELYKAKEKANQIFKFMRNLGFNQPVICESGNGVHLLYHVLLKKEDDRVKLVKKCLETLNLLFTDEYVGVDVKNFNPSRITKLYGTTSQKGSSTENRPHRNSRIVGDYDTLVPTDIVYLEKLITYLPKKEEPQKYNNYKPRDFDLREWLDKHNIRYTESPYSGGTKYILEECPFDSNHKGKDACIFQGSDGAIGFHCFHNSCADKKWRDIRIMFEPNAYEKKNEYRKYSRNEKEEVRNIEKVGDDPVFLSSNDIMNSIGGVDEFLKSGVSDIDSKMRGLRKGAVTLMSGLRASGKSSLLSQIMLNLIQEDHKPIVYSGELTPKNFLKWLVLQAAGKGFTESTIYENYFTVSTANQKKITDWIDGKFFLFNNNYGNQYQAILDKIESKIDETGSEVVILDNLMAFDIASLSADKYEAQKFFANSISSLAKRKNVHIIYVAHPRKALGFLRLEDVSGTADLSNLADSVFIVHRVNKDFRKLTAQEFKWKEDHECYKCTNVVEIAKDRESGIQDHFIPLFYEKETKRLKNSEAENVIYGWNKSLVEGFDNVGENDTPFD